jgi:hypothetical protein
MNKKNLNIIVYVLLLSLILFSCQIENEDKTAKLVTLTELLNVLPGFEWFPYEFNRYQPDTSVSRQIDSLWKLKRYNFILFVNPSCNCEGSQVTFPIIVKCLKSGNVPDSSIIIYSMLNETYSHPFSKKFLIKKLPACFTQIDSSKSLYYSIIDTFEVYRNKFPGKYQYEHIILFSLQK